VIDLIDFIFHRGTLQRNTLEKSAPKVWKSLGGSRSYDLVQFELK